MYVRYTSIISRVTHIMHVHGHETYSAYSLGPALEYDDGVACESLPIGPKWLGMMTSVAGRRISPQTLFGPSTAQESCTSFLKAGVAFLVSNKTCAIPYIIMGR
jgi:hypothetical protein